MKIRIFIFLFQKRHRAYQPKRGGGGHEVQRPKVYINNSTAGGGGGSSKTYSIFANYKRGARVGVFLQAAPNKVVFMLMETKSEQPPLLGPLIRSPEIY